MVEKGRRKMGGQGEGMRTGRKRSIPRSRPGQTDPDETDNFADNHEHENGKDVSMSDEWTSGHSRHGGIRLWETVALWMRLRNEVHRKRQKCARRRLLQRQSGQVLPTWRIEVAKKSFLIISNKLLSFYIM